MPALAQERLYTIDDIYALPNGERAELIDGNDCFNKFEVVSHDCFQYQYNYNQPYKNNRDCIIPLLRFAIFPHTFCALIKVHFSKDSY